MDDSSISATAPFLIYFAGYLLGCGLGGRQS